MCEKSAAWQRWQRTQFWERKSSPCLCAAWQYEVSPEMTSLPAKVIEKRGDQYQVIVQIGAKYRGSFNTLAFGETKPYSGSLKDGRLDLVYYRDPSLNVGDPFPLWTLHCWIRSPAFRAMSLQGVLVRLE